MLIVTYNQKHDTIFENLTEEKYIKYNKFFNRTAAEISFQNKWNAFLIEYNNSLNETSKQQILSNFVNEWYNLNNNYIGQYIVTRSASDETSNENGNSINNTAYPGPGPQVQKLTIPDNFVYSVNNLSPDSNGNITLKFQNIIDAELAAYLIKIKSDETELEFMNEYRPHFTIGNSPNSGSVPYARFDELSAFFDHYKNTTDKISSNFENLKMEFDDIIDNKFGQIPEDSPNEIKEKLKLPVYTQLNNIYSSMMNLNDNIGNIQFLNFKFIETETLTGILEPNNEQINFKCIIESNNQKIIIPNYQVLKIYEILDNYCETIYTDIIFDTQENNSIISFNGINIINKEFKLVLFKNNEKYFF